MAATATESSVIAKRYAVSLLDMAEEAKKIETVEKDLKDFLAMLKDSQDLQNLISNPLFTRDQQGPAIEALAKKAKFTVLTSNFLGVLVVNRRLFAVEAVIKAFQQELRQRRGEIEARVETAFALSAEQTKRLQKELSAKLGSNVTLNVSVNKDLLGGMVVTVGSRMIDNSVRRKLSMLQSAMNANEQQQKEVG